MIDYLNGITSRSPYRKTQEAALLQRLCGDAWAVARNRNVPDSIREEVRGAAIRSALTLTTDEESDVLRRFGYLAECGMARLKLRLDGHSHSYTIVELGCGIGVPARLVDHRGIMTVTPASYERTRGSIDVPVEVDESIHDFFRERDAAERGYEAEMSRIVSVSRGVGAPSTWGRMLESLPVTRDYFEASSAGPARDELMAA